MLWQHRNTACCIENESNLPKSTLSIFVRMNSKLEKLDIFAVFKLKKTKKLTLVRIDYTSIQIKIYRVCTLGLMMIINKLWALTH